MCVKELTDGAKCDVDALTEWVKAQIPDAELGRDVAGEVNYVLPISAVAAFETFFRELKSNQKRFGISAFGVTMTTLEEVFLRLRELQEEDDRAAEAAKDATGKGDSADGKSDGRGGLFGLVRGVFGGNRGRDIEATATTASTGLPAAGSAATVRSAASGDRLGTSANISMTSTNSPNPKHQFKTMIAFNVRRLGRNASTFIWPVFMPVLFVVIGLALLSGNTPDAAQTQPVCARR